MTVVQEVLKLIRSDLVNHSVVAHTELATDLPPVKGDRVQLPASPAQSGDERL